ncbi:unnamed protein product [Diatraea saccharalis]|uniref:CHHC U11-48K-type domain-containing protein n=1 Tax=Diatraea saccharalis TaxID=40085 RepID=A0A9N9QU96_9NEOP|nr:unnamed protein product [Diatraea saccharalis]
MESREKELKNVQTFIGKIDTEVTMILQQLQWDRSSLLEKPSMVTCKYNSNHRIPAEKRDIHETECYFRTNGYSNEDVLLPDPVDSNAGILIKLDKNDIKSLIDQAAKADPTFKRGTGSDNAEPMSLERLQATYTADERRVIHDAVVKAAPSCHDLTDLALLCDNEDEQKNAKQKSRLEILAELRDMKRRRTKYRVAAKTRNYSDLLRDVIKTQMEVYSSTKEEQTKQKQQEQDKDDKRRYDNEKFQTYNNAVDSGDNHNREKYKLKDRIKDNVKHGHYRYDSDKTRRDTYDNSHKVNSSITEDEGNKRRKRKRSRDRSHKESKNEKDCKYEYAASNYQKEKDRYKRNRYSESQRRPKEDYRGDKYTSNYYDKAHSSRSNYNKDTKDKIVQTKYKSKDATSPVNNTYKYEDSHQICVKQEPDTDSDNSQRNSYNYDESKFRVEKSHFKNKSDKYNRDRYTRRKTPKREDCPRYRRYYD